MKPDHPLKRLEHDGHAAGFYGFSQHCMWALVRSIWREKLQISGVGNIPASGPALVAINQTTHLDPLFVAVAVQRPIHFIGLDDGGEAEPWYTPLLYRSIGVIDMPESLVRRGGHRFAFGLESAVRYGELIGIFPEGRIERKRNRTAIAPFRKGVATIARQYHLPVVPILMRGTEKVIPGSTARLHEKIYVRPISISIGRPLPADDVRNEECVRQALINLEEQRLESSKARQQSVGQGSVAPAQNPAD